jgi:hypothetical protein
MDLFIIFLSTTFQPSTAGALMAISQGREERSLMEEKKAKPSHLAIIRIIPYTKSISRVVNSERGWRRGGGWCLFGREGVKSLGGGANKWDEEGRLREKERASE